MKHLKMVALGSLAAMALISFAASTASASTVELTKVIQNQPVTVTTSQSPGGTLVYARTDGTLANTCAASHWHLKTASFTPRPRGPVTSYAIAECTNPVTVHKAGEISFENISGTANGTVFSEETEVTVATSLGFTVNCKTGAGTDIGTLTGSEAGNATLHVNAVLNCGFLLPSASLKGSWVVTSPHGLKITG